jgi:hypothetical protein
MSSLYLCLCAWVCKWLERSPPLLIILMYMIILVCRLWQRSAVSKAARCVFFYLECEGRIFRTAAIWSRTLVKGCALSHVPIVRCKAGVPNYFWQRATQLLLWPCPRAARKKSPSGWFNRLCHGFDIPLARQKDKHTVLFTAWTWHRGQIRILLTPYVCV